MLLARRRLWWLVPVAVVFVNCSEEPPPNTILPTPTSIIVKPESFLGDVACGTETGGLLSYQATLIDVTEGLENAPRLPSSSVVDCTSTIVFETVTIGHRYGALIAAFDRSDLETEDEGSQTVLDPDGNEVLPRWTTRCTGYDGEIEQALGGAGGGAGEGGWTGNASLGVLALEHAAIPVGGCEPLSGDFDPNLTGVRVDLTSALGGLACGTAAGQVDGYSVDVLGGEPVGGGIGGAGGTDGAESDLTPCAEPFVLRGLGPGEWLTLEVSAFEADAAAPTWSATCTARTEFGTLVAASCARLRPL